MQAQHNQTGGAAVHLAVETAMPDAFAAAERWIEGWQRLLV